MSTIVVGSTNAVVQQGSTSTIVVSPAPASTLVQTGLMGPIASGSDKYYRHDQSTASDIWTIMHPLDKYPSVTIVDSAGDEVEGAVNYLSTTTVVVTFSAAFSGSAFLN